MEKVELEYQRVKLSKLLLSISTRGLNSRQSYEMRNILERWLLGLYNRYGLPESWELLPTPSDQVVDEKAAQEILEKGIRPTLEESQTLVNSLWNQVEQFELTVFAGGLRPAEIRLTQTEISYKDEEFRLTERIGYLLGRWSREDIMRMLLRYESVLPGGQQWGIPWPVADILYSLGFRNEGFASPINSRLLDKPDTRFCSLFKDTDAIFGSLGSFFEVTLSDYPGAWIINPPYLPSLFDHVLEKIETYLQKQGSRAFVLLPYWTDTQIYQRLSEHPALITREIMDGGSYYYHGINKEMITPRVKAVYFILGDPLPPEILVQIRSAWRPLR